jgi:hypothetical protein
VPGNPFESPPDEFVENPGGRTISISAFDQFGVDVFLKHLASAQLFILGLAVCHKRRKDVIREDALFFAAILVGNKVGGVRIVVPVVPVFAAFALSLSEEVNGGGPVVGLVVFEFEDPN